MSTQFSCNNMGIFNSHKIILCFFANILRLFVISVAFPKTAFIFHVVREIISIKSGMYIRCFSDLFFFIWKSSRLIFNSGVFKF